jgi:hypothetical protein
MTMKKTRKRTTFTLFVEFLKEVGGEQVTEAFLKDAGPFLKANSVARPLSEEEYQFWLERMRPEIPAFRQYLLQLKFESQ